MKIHAVEARTTAGGRGGCDCSDSDSGTSRRVVDLDWATACNGLCSSAVCEEVGRNVGVQIRGVQCRDDHVMSAKRFPWDDLVCHLM